MKPPPPTSKTVKSSQDVIMIVQFSSYKRTRRRPRQRRKSSQQSIKSDELSPMAPRLQQPQPPPCQVHSYSRSRPFRGHSKPLELPPLLFATLLCLNLAHTLPSNHHVACSPTEPSHSSPPLDAYKFQASSFNRTHPHHHLTADDLDSASLIGHQINLTRDNRMRDQLLPSVPVEPPRSQLGRPRRHDGLDQDAPAANAIEFRSQDLASAGDKGRANRGAGSGGGEKSAGAATTIGVGKSQDFGDYEVPSDEQEETGDEVDRGVPTSALTNWPAGADDSTNNSHQKYNSNDQLPARIHSNQSAPSLSGPTTTDWLLANSFLSHIDKQWKFAEIILIIVISAILNLVTIVGNIMVLISFKMDRSLQTVSNYFLLSLALADLLIGLISMPLYTLYLLLNYWPLGPLMCDIWLAIDYLNSNAAVLNMLIISFDRYFSVTRPLTYRAKRTTKHAILMISFAWILSLTIWTPAIFTYPYYKGRTVQGTDKCEIEFVKANTYLTFVTAILAFYIPVAIMIYLYWRIWLETKKRYRDLTTLFLVSGVGAAAPSRPNRPIISAITAGSSNSNNNSDSKAPVPGQGRRLANIASSASAKSHLVGRSDAKKTSSSSSNNNNLSAPPCRKLKSSLKSGPGRGELANSGQKQVGCEQITADTRRKGAGAAARAATGEEAAASSELVSEKARPRTSQQELGATFNDDNRAVSLMLLNQSRDQPSSAGSQKAPGDDFNANSKCTAPIASPFKHCKCAASCCYTKSSCAPATALAMPRQIPCKVALNRRPFIVDNCKACQEYIRQHNRAVHSDKKARGPCGGEQLAGAKTATTTGACCSSCCCPCTGTSSQTCYSLPPPPPPPAPSPVPMASDSEAPGASRRPTQPANQQPQQEANSKENKRVQSPCKQPCCSCSNCVTTPSCCQVASGATANNRTKLALALGGQSQPHQDQKIVSAPATVGSSSSKSIYQLISDASGPPQRVKIHPKLSSDTSPTANGASVNQLEANPESQIRDTGDLNEHAQREQQATEEKCLVDVATSPINFGSPVCGQSDSKMAADRQLGLQEESFEQEDFETRIVSSGDRLRFESNDPRLIRATSDGSNGGPNPHHHHTNGAPPAPLQAIDVDGGKQPAAPRCCCIEVISAHDAECKFCRPIAKPDQYFIQHQHQKQQQPIGSSAGAPLAAASRRLVDGSSHQPHHHGLDRGGHSHHHHHHNHNQHRPVHHGHQHNGHHHHGHHSHNHHNNRSHSHFHHHQHQHHHQHGHCKRSSSSSGQLAPASKHKLKSDCKTCLIRFQKMPVPSGGSSRNDRLAPAEICTKTVATTRRPGQEANNRDQTAALDLATETSGSLPILGALQGTSPDRLALVTAESGACEDAPPRKVDSGPKYKKLSQKLTFSDILIEERAPSTPGGGSNKPSANTNKSGAAGVHQNRTLPKCTGTLSKSQRAEKLRNLYDDPDEGGSDRSLAEGSEGDGRKRWFKNAYSSLVNWHFVASMPQIGVLMPCKRASRNRPLSCKTNESFNREEGRIYRYDDEHDDADEEDESDNDDRDVNSDGSAERVSCADADPGAPTREKRRGGKILNTLFCATKPLIKRFSSNESSSCNETATVADHQKAAKHSTGSSNGHQHQQSRLISPERHQQQQQRHGSSHYNNSSSKSSSSASQSDRHQHQHQHHHHPIQPKSERKAAKTLSTLLLVFIVTWLPYNVLVLIKTLSGGEGQVPEKIWNFSYYLCYINSTINPLCYALCNAQFRRTYMRILKCKLSNEHNSTRRLVPIQSSSTWNKDLRLNSTSILECGNSTSQASSIAGSANSQLHQQVTGSGRKRKQPRRSK